MMNQNGEDWLPPGWTVQLKIRKSGKKDKYYIETSSQMRFNSRAEVFRYLKTAAICHPQSQERRTIKQSGNNVEVQKTSAQGLPPGWIKEIRERRTANRIRRDSYYIDPVHGNTLRSIRDVHRYLTTGKVSRFGYKSKNQKDSNVEFQRDDISIKWSKNSSEPSEITNEGAIFPNAATAGESTPLSVHNSRHGVIGTEVDCSTQLDRRGSEQSDGENDFYELVSTPDKSIQQKCVIIDDGRAKNESKKTHGKTKEDANLPRRASKRLAGLQAELVLEVKTSRRARLGACEECDKQVASTSQCPEKSDETKSIIEKSQDAREQGVLEKRVGEIECEDEGLLLKLPVENLLTDPCIAFAVKTLTGRVFDESIVSEASLVPNHMDRPSTPELPVTRVGKVENNNVVKKLESTSELPVGEILTDPCIEFAIKTLTGEIPLDICPEIEDYFHKLSSSKTQESNANASNRIGSDYFDNSNILGQKPQVIQAVEASPSSNF